MKLDEYLEWEKNHPELINESIEKYFSDMEKEVEKEKAHVKKDTFTNKAHINGWRRKRVYKDKLGRRFANVYPSVLTNAHISRGDGFGKAPCLYLGLFSPGYIIGGGELVFDEETNATVRKMPETFPMRLFSVNPYEHLFYSRHGSIEKYHGSISGGNENWWFGGSWVKKEKKGFLLGKSAMKKSFTKLKMIKKSAVLPEQHTRK